MGEWPEWAKGRPHQPPGCPDPTPQYIPPQQLTPGGPVHGGFVVTEQSPASDIPKTTALGLHLLSEHRLANAHRLTVEEQFDIHAHEHAGPGTIRNHPVLSLAWSDTKVRETLAQLNEVDDALSTAVEPAPVGVTNAEFAELTVYNDCLMLRVPGCTCEGATDVEGAGHRSAPS